jgi:hypothetical protein
MNVSERLERLILEAERAYDEQHVYDDNIKAEGILINLLEDLQVLLSDINKNEEILNYEI